MSKPPNGHKRGNEAYIDYMERQLGMCRAVLAVAIERAGGEMTVTPEQVADFSAKGQALWFTANADGSTGIKLGEAP